MVAQDQPATPQHRGRQATGGIDRRSGLDRLESDRTAQGVANGTTEQTAHDPILPAPEVIGRARKRLRGRQHRNRMIRNLRKHPRRDQGGAFRVCASVDQDVSAAAQVLTKPQPRDAPEALEPWVRCVPARNRQVMPLESARFDRCAQHADACFEHLEVFEQGEHRDGTPGPNRIQVPFEIAPTSQPVFGSGSQPGT